jgi:hypothetical protein
MSEEDGWEDYGGCFTCRRHASRLSYKPVKLGANLVCHETNLEVDAERKLLNDQS